MLRLSVIIPFYNVEQYIAQCLDSVYNQDIPEEEYEVICVNDASPDNSRNIVLEYQKKHSNLVLVEHEVNKKLGAARNTGRRIACGKYIWNVDSDDMIASNCLGKMLERCEKNELDILCFSYVELLPTGKFEKKDEGKSFGVKSGVEFMHQYGCSRLGNLCPVWRFVFRKGFLDENDIYSPEINMGEDVPYTFKSLFLARKVAFVDEVWYEYRINENSLTGSKKVLLPEVLYEKCFKNTWLILDVMQYLPKDDAELIKACKNVAKYTFNLWRDFYKMMDDENKKIFRSMCRRQYANDRKVLKLVMSHNKYYLFVLWMMGISKE